MCEAPTKPSWGPPWDRGIWWRRAMVLPFIGGIRLYQVTLGLVMGGHCRFEPSCSHYGAAAYELHGPIRGTWLTVKRIARCHPFGGQGFDPVPPAPPRSGEGNRSGPGGER